jgi:hypothetical protein
MEPSRSMSKSYPRTCSRFLYILMHMLYVRMLSDVVSNLTGLSAALRKMTGTCYSTSGSRSIASILEHLLKGSTPQIGDFRPRRRFLTTKSYGPKVNSHERPAEALGQVVIPYIQMQSAILS